MFDETLKNKNQEAAIWRMVKEVSARGGLYKTGNRRPILILSVVVNEERFERITRIVSCLVANRNNPAGTPGSMPGAAQQEIRAEILEDRVTPLRIPYWSFTVKVEFLKLLYGLIPFATNYIFSTKATITEKLLIICLTVELRRIRV